MSKRNTCVIPYVVLNVYSKMYFTKNSTAHATKLNTCNHPYFSMIQTNSLFQTPFIKRLIGYNRICWVFFLRSRFYSQPCCHHISCSQQKNIRGNKALLLLTENKFYLFVGILIFILTINSVFGE